jgi:hypothetical protein
MNTVRRYATPDQVWYYTGMPCKNGHVDRRYTNTGICYACKRQNMSLDYARNTERVLETNRRSYTRHAAERVARSVAWHRRNPEASRAIKARYREANRSRINADSAAYQSSRCLSDPAYHISKRVSKSLWNMLRGYKGGARWESILGYTARDLVEHLRPKLSPGMTLENYGSYWHIDHIVPVAYFRRRFSGNPIHAAKLCFALVNLRPLEAKTNLSKNAAMLPHLVNPVLSELGILGGSGDNR